MRPVRPANRGEYSGAGKPPIRKNGNRRSDVLGFFRKYPFLSFEIDLICGIFVVGDDNGHNSKEFSSFARGLLKDIDAVENAVASPLSNGFVEGQTTS